jgi:hypothetical protein
MTDTRSETTAWSTARTDELSHPPGELSTYVDCSQPIVPPAWRYAFLAERWIAGRPCVVQPSVGATALLVDASFSGLYCEFTARYCYEDAEEALLALRDWDGRLDPPGNWTQEVVTSRIGPGVFDDSHLRR